MYPSSPVLIATPGGKGKQERVLYIGVHGRAVHTYTLWMGTSDLGCLPAPRSWVGRPEDIASTVSAPAGASSIQIEQPLSRDCARR